MSGITYQFTTIAERKQCADACAWYAAQCDHEVRRALRRRSLSKEARDLIISRNKADAVLLRQAAVIVDSSPIAA